MKWFLGAICGLINGLLGAGGGAAAVIALKRWVKIEEKRAHATALAVMLPMSIVSAVVYLRGAQLQILPLILITTGGLAGGWLGAKWLGKISLPWLNRIFGAVMVLAAVRMIV